MKKKIYRISEPEIRERLCLDNEKLVSQVLYNAYKFYDESLNSRKDVDEKTNWLLAITCLSITIFFTVVNVLIEKLKGNIIAPNSFYFISALCLISLFFAVLFFYVAIRARSDFRTFNEEDILNKTELEEAEKESNSCKRYDRYITAHLIDIGIKNNNVNERKAKWLVRGQWLFLIGLLLLSIVSIMLTYSFIYKKENNTMSESQQEQKPQPTSPTTGGKPTTKDAPKPKPTTPTSEGRKTTLDNKGNSDLTNF